MVYFYGFDCLRGELTVWTGNHSFWKLIAAVTIWVSHGIIIVKKICKVCGSMHVERDFYTLRQSERTITAFLSTARTCWLTQISKRKPRVHFRKFDWWTAHNSQTDFTDRRPLNRSWRGRRLTDAEPIVCRSAALNCFSLSAASAASHQRGNCYASHRDKSSSISISHPLAWRIHRDVSYFNQSRRRVSLSDRAFKLLRVCARPGTAQHIKIATAAFVRHNIVEKAIVWQSASEYVKFVVDEIGALKSVVTTSKSFSYLLVALWR